MAAEDRRLRHLPTPGRRLKGAANGDDPEPPSPTPAMGRRRPHAQPARAAARFTARPARRRVRAAVRDRRLHLRRPACVGPRRDARDRHTGDQRHRHAGSPAPRAVAVQRADRGVRDRPLPARRRAAPGHPGQEARAAHLRGGRRIRRLAHPAGRHRRQLLVCAPVAPDVPVHGPQPPEPEDPVGRRDRVRAPPAGARRGARPVARADGDPAGRGLLRPRRLGIRHAGPRRRRRAARPAGRAEDVRRARAAAAYAAAGVQRGPVPRRRRRAARTVRRFDRRGDRLRRRVRQGRALHAAEEVQPAIRGGRRHAPGERDRDPARVG